MKNICLYFLTLIIAAGSTGMYEFLKLPALVEHYREHRADNTASGPEEFISMHYLGHDRKDDDAPRDNALPFKHIQYRAYLMFFTIGMLVKEAMPMTIETVQRSLYSKNIKLFQLIFTCFRPPCTSFFTVK